MRCIYQRCNSADIRIMRTSHDDQHGETSIIQRYSGMNLKRRRYKCQRCGSSFHTIEMPELIFDQLRVGNKTIDVMGGPEVPINIRKSR